MRFLKRFAIFLLITGVIAVCWFQWWHLSKSLIPLVDSTKKGNLQFTLQSPLPIRITEGGGTAWQNKFYVAGGIDAFGRTLNTFYAFDNTNATWTRLPDLPAYINHPGVVAQRGKIFIVGGFDPIGIRLRWLMFADWKPLNTVYIYDIASGQWSRGPNMPVKRGAGGIASNDSAIWYIGGINEQKEIAADFHYLSLNSMQWKELPSMKTPRDHMRMEYVDGKLYALSGRKDDLRKNLGNVEVFDVQQQTWSAVDNIPTPRGGFSSIVAGKYIYTFGGESFYNCFNEIERLNTVTGKWEKLPSLPEARHGIIAGIINNKIHLISGGRHPRISTSNIHRVLEIQE